jgi:hypothetical protein
VYEILQCHTLFRVALCDCVRHWDRDEKIGDVFFACFSKGVVLEIYSEFINNFTRAMELAKLESSRKSVFADFLKVCLSFFIVSNESSFYPHKSSNRAVNEMFLYKRNECCVYANYNKGS